jgi:hypothetical protein
VTPYAVYLGTVMDLAVLKRSALTPYVRLRFRLAAQLDARPALNAEFLRVYRHMRRVRRRMRLPGGATADGAVAAIFSGVARAFFDTMRVMALRQVERGLLPRLRPAATIKRADE